MALQVWLPLNGNLNNQGLSNLTFSINNSSNTIIDNSGKIGKCYSNNSFSAGGLLSNTTINLGTNQSMFCWFKFTNLTNSSSLGGAMITQHRYPKNTGMGLTIKYVSSTTGYLSINTGNGSSRTYNTYCGTTLLQANTWYHGGYTYDGTTIKLYLNGVCEKEVSYSGMSTPTDYIAVYCWAFNGNSGTGIEQNYRLNGSLNDVRIYDHALSAKEVEVLSRGLVCHYPLNGGGRGGDNLLKNTGDLTLWAKEAGITTTWDSEKNLYKIEDSAHTSSRWGIYQDLNITADTTYTITCTLDGNSCGVGFGFYDSSISGFPSPVMSTSGTKIKQSYTITSGASSTKCRIYLYTNCGSSKVAWFSLPKVEKGDKSTPWIPNSADTAYTAMGYDSTTEYDVSGYGYNGTKNGTMTYSSDTARYSVSTNFAKSPYIQTTLPLPNGDGKHYTFSWWGKYTNYSGHMMWGYANGNRLNLYMASGNFYWNTGDGSNNPFGVSAATYGNNAWHHFVVTGDGTVTKLYIDGEFKADAKAYKPITGTTLIFNGWATSTDYDFNGSLSDFRLYATALSAAQVAELYNTAVSVANNGTLLGYELVEV